MHLLEHLLAMGNICSGSKEEARKHAALQEADASPTDIPSNVDLETNNEGASALEQDPGMSATPATDAAYEETRTSEEEQKRREEEALRLEQERLEMIVQTANRQMVSVRSTRGSNAYYDQGT